jgi:hypothetical protein
VDGALAATAHDTTITTGTSMLKFPEEGSAIRDLAIAELPADFASKLAPAVAPAAGEQWHDAIAELLKRPLPDFVTRDGAGIRVSKRAGVIPAPQHFTGIAVRATARAEASSKGWQIALRANNGTADCYMAGLYRGGHRQLSVFTNGKVTTDHDFVMPAGFSIDVPHTLEFRALGTRLMLVLDGAVIVDLQDSTHTSGQWMLLGDDGTHFEKVEYRELTPLTVTAASEKWNDGLAEWFAANTSEPADLAKKEGGGLRVGKITSVNFNAWESRTRAHQGDLADVALRATISDAAGGCNLCLRTGEKSRYSAGFGIAEYCGIRLYFEDGTWKMLKKFDLPASFDASARHTVEFRAQGDMLVFLLDGTEMVRVQDSSRKTGGGYVIASPGSLVEKLEYRELEPGTK